MEGRRRLRGLALMGVVWAGAFLGVLAGGAWFTGKQAAIVFGVAVGVFARRRVPPRRDLRPARRRSRRAAAPRPLHGVLELHVADRLLRRAGDRRLRPPAQAARALAGCRRRSACCASAYALAIERRIPAHLLRTPSRRFARRRPGYHGEHGASDRRSPQYRCPACPASGGRGLTRFAEAVAPRPEPRVAELSANGLTWIHLDPPIDPETVNALRERFGWHPLDVEDVLSKRQRPKIDDYADEGYLFGVLHFPAYDKNVQRLNAGELDFFLGPDYLVTISNVELLPVTRLFNRVQEDERFREQLFSKGSGPTALRGARRPVRLLLPDPRQDRLQARLDRGRHRGPPLGGDRHRHLQGEAGDHLLPQDHQAPASRAAPARAADRALPARRTSSSTSTTSSTRPSASGTCWTTTRKSSKHSRARTSR